MAVKDLDDAFWPALSVWAAKLGVPASWLLLVFYTETRLNPKLCNAAGFCGLNQLASSTLRNQFHVDPAVYATWPASIQLTQVVGPWYLQTLNTYLNAAPRSPGVFYALNLGPARVKSQGQGANAVIYSAPAAAYTQNKGLDVNGDGAITIGDLDAFMARLSGEAPFKEALAKLGATAPYAAAGGGGDVNSRSDYAIQLGPTTGELIAYGTMGAAAIGFAILLARQGKTPLGEIFKLGGSKSRARENPIPRKELTDKQLLAVGGGLLGLSGLFALVSAGAGKRAGGSSGLLGSGSPTPLEAAIVARAQSDLGLIESAPNDGPRVKQMLANVGVNVPANWCAAAVSTWIQEAARAQGTRPPIKGSAGVLALMQQFQALNQFVGVNQLRANPAMIAPGMVVIWSRGSTGSGLGHTGIVLQNAGGGKFTTIEGNAGANSDRVVQSTHDLTSTTLQGMGYFKPQGVGVGYYNDPPGVQDFPV